MAKLKLIGVEIHKFEPFVLTQSEMDQLNILTKQISTDKFDPIFSQKIKIKMREILEQASFKMRTGKSKVSHVSEQKLLGEHQRISSLYEQSQEFYKERIQKIKAESHDELHGNYGLIRMTINEYSKRNPDRLKGSAVTEAIIAAESKSKMVKFKSTSKLESMIFKEEPNFNLNAQPFRPKQVEK